MKKRIQYASNRYKIRQCVLNYRRNFMQGEVSFFMNKVKTEVAICGKNYTVVSSESPEYVAKVGEYVDEKLSAILNSNSGFSTSTAAVLMSINITDELFKAKEATEHMRKLIGQYIEEESKQKARAYALQEENEELKKQIGELSGATNA
jgi:cell division protein ZapA